MRALFPKKNSIKQKCPNSVVIFINNASFAKSAYVMWPRSSTLWGMAFQPNKWLVPGMVGIG